MNRFFASACLLLVATACGAATSVSSTQSGAFSAKEWCAEYRQVLTGAGFSIPDAGSGTAPVGPQDLPEPSEAQLVSMLEKLRPLADKAPAEIRDDLQAMWSVPEEVLRGEVPTGPPPENWEAFLAQQSDALRWINDTCGVTGPSGEERLPPDFQEIRPVGDWRAVQNGTVGKFAWTFFRTGAADGGVCVAFEAEPSYVDWEARIRAQIPIGSPTPFPPIAPPSLSDPSPDPSDTALPPGAPVPPVGPPPVPGLDYKGKLPQCGPAPDLFDRSDPVMFWVQDQDATNHYNVLAGLVVGSARSLTITFDQGGQQIVTPIDGTFVATYDAKLRVAKVVPDLGPGSQVSCAPVPVGAVSIPNLTPPVPIPPISLSCQGSVNRSGVPMPPVGQPKR